jgi:hypothetical protein
MTTASNLNKITAADIARAAQVDDIDDALRPLQDIAEIDDGGVAAHAFSDMEDVENDWRKLSQPEREERIRDWLRLETSYCVTDGEPIEDVEQIREEQDDKIIRRLNWDDPAARLTLIESVGADEYNRLHAEHMRRQTVANVNGHGIRTIGSRFGRLFMVEGTDRAFSTQAEAETFARTL